MTRKRTLRRVAVVAMASMALVGMGPVAVTASADPVPTFDFADCPALPNGEDPAQWRCEVLMSGGTIAFGSLPELDAGAMRMTFAERNLGEEFAQVFGALRADPIRVPGGLLGTGDRNPLLRMDIRIEYAGFADFLSVGDRMGEQHLKIRVRSPLLPQTCTIGSNSDPIKFRPVRVSGPDVVSPEPLVLRFTIEDNEFAVPTARGCGAFDHFVNRRFGLPASGGANAISFTTLVGLKTYPQL